MCIKKIGEAFCYDESIFLICRPYMYFHDVIILL
jgi:hypothetical protein